jgi:phasin family protein
MCGAVSVFKILVLPQHYSCNAPVSHYVSLFSSMETHPMYPNIFNEPIQKLNNLAINNTEKLTAFQLASLQSYTELGVAQLKAASKVHDSDSFLKYLIKQSEYMMRIGAQGVADANTAYQMGVNLVSDAQKVAEENVAVVTEPPKKVGRKVA